MANDLGNYFVGVGLDMSDFNSGINGALANLVDATNSMVEAIQGVVAQVESSAGEIGEGFEQAAEDSNDSAENVEGGWTKALGNIKTKFEEVRAIIGGVGLGIAAVLGESVKKTLEFQEAVINLQRQTNMSVQDASAWVGIAKEWGIESQTLTMGMMSLMMRMDAANKSTNEGNTVFDRYKIALKDATGATLPMNQVLMEIADKIHSLGRGQQASAVAMETMGRAGRQLLPMFLQGSDAVKEAMQTLKNYGVVMEDQEPMEKYMQAQRNFKLATLGLETQLGSVLLPVVLKLSEAITNLCQMYNQLSDPTKAAITQFLTWGSAIGIALGGLAALQAIFSALGGPFLALNKVIGLLSNNTLSLGTIFTTVGSKLISVGRAVGVAMFEALGPIGLIILGIAAVVAILYEAWTHNFGGIQQATASWIQAISDGLNQFLEGLEQWVKSCADYIVDLGTAIWDLINGDFSGAKAAGERVLGDAGGAFLGFSKMVVGSVRTIVGGLGTVVTGAGAMVKGVKNALAGGIGSISGFWKRLTASPGNAPDEGGDGLSDGEGGRDGGRDGGAGKGEKGKGDDGKDAYAIAKEEYEKEIEMAQYTSDEKLAIYHQYLDNVQKDADEECDYKVGAHKLEFDSVKDNIDKQQAYLDYNRQAEEMDEKTYDSRSFDLKKAAVEAQIDFEVKARMDLLSSKKKMTDQESATAQAAIRMEVMGLTDIIKQNTELLALKNKLLKDDAATADLLAEQVHDNDQYDTSKMKAYYDTLNEYGLVSVQQNADNQKRIIDANEKADQDLLDSKNAQTIADFNAQHTMTDAYISYETEKTNIARNYANQRDQIDRDSLKNQMKNLQTLTTDITDAFGTMLKDTLTFSSSIRQAFQTMFQSIISSLVSAFIQPYLDRFKTMLAQKLMAQRVAGSSEVAAQSVTEAAKLGLTVAGAASGIAATTTAGAVAIETASMTTGATMTMLGSIGAALSAIPWWGWVGLAILAGVEAGQSAGSSGASSAVSNLGRSSSSYFTNSSIANVPSYDVGSWNVPKDTLAQVHKNEMIVPANFADNARALISGKGRGDVHVNVTSAPQVSTIDSRGAKEFFDQHANLLGDTITKRLVRTFKLNSSIRG